MNRQARNKEQIAGHIDDSQNQLHNKHDHSGPHHDHMPNKHEHDGHDNTQGDHDHSHDEHDHSHDGHDHGGNQKTGWKQHWDLLAAAGILVTLLTLEYAFNIQLPRMLSLSINTLAY